MRVPVEALSECYHPAMVSIVALVIAFSADAPRDSIGSSATNAHLEVRGAASCISPEDLASRIAKRSKRIHLVHDAVVSAVVTVTSQRPGAVVTELTLTAPGAQPTARRVVARSCAEAADAVALILVVTLDPAPGRSQPNASGPQPGVGRDAPASIPRPAATNPAAGSNGSRAAPGAPAATAPEPAGAARPPSDSAPSAEPKPAATPSTPATPESPAAPRPEIAEGTRQELARTRGIPTGTTLHIGPLAGAEVLFGPASKALPGVTVSVVLTAEREGPWIPALYVGWIYAGRSGLVASDGSASFSLNAASVDACPLRWRWRWLSVRPCASLLAGRMEVRGSDTPQPASTSRRYAASGMAVAATAGGTLYLAVRAGVGATLIRDSYDFGPGTAVFFQAGRLTTSLSLGLGLSWP